MIILDEEAFAIGNRARLRGIVIVVLMVISADNIFEWFGGRRYQTNFLRNLVKILLKA